MWRWRQLRTDPMLRTCLLLWGPCPEMSNLSTSLGHVAGRWGASYPRLFLNQLLAQVSTGAACSAWPPVQTPGRTGCQGPTQKKWRQ